MERVEMTIYGRVQGVFFRDNTQKMARELALGGYVKNQPDGTVFVVAEGEKSALDRLVAWCHEGPDMARVQKVDVQRKEPLGEFKTFSVRL